jgi:hypothetical protein
MKNTQNKQNKTNSLDERQDEAQVRNERSCPQSSGSPLNGIRSEFENCRDDTKTILDNTDEYTPAEIIDSVRKMNEISKLYLNQLLASVDSK